MISRVVLALAAALALSAPASAGSAAAYDVKASPLDELSRDLLSGNGYEFRQDGKVWDKISEAPVPHDEMPYLLTHLAGARRLKALLQLNLILNRSEGEKQLTDAERESVRTLVRQAWPVFGVGTRRDFRAYFTVQELETLDKIPPRFDKTSALTSMKDPEPESVTAAPPPVMPVTALPPPATVEPPPVVPVPQPTAPQAIVPAAVTPIVPASYVPSLPPLSAPPSLRRPSPFSTATAVAPAPAAAAIGVFKPWTPPASSTAPLLGRLAVSLSTPAAVVAVATVTIEAPAIVPPPPSEPAKPAIPDIGAEQYDKFVAEGPYTNDGKALLKLIGSKAPEHCLPLLRRTVLAAMPQIVTDGTRTGAGLRAGLLVDAAKPDAPPIVALSPGAVYVERKSGLFGPKQALLIPESPAVYAELGIPPPPIEALKKDAVPTGVENGPWGATKLFADGSRRGSYSAQEQAGELLEHILLLGLRRENLDASAYAARRWARTARLMFSSRLKDDLGQDGFLDPDRRAELRAWLERPEESDDETLSSWAGSRLALLDPRRGSPEGARAFESRARGSCVRSTLEDALAEAAGRRARRVGALETLLSAELTTSQAAKTAAQAAADEETAVRKKLISDLPTCPAVDPGRDEALRKASLLMAEALRAERSLREKKMKGDEHAD